MSGCSGSTAAKVVAAKVVPWICLPRRETGLSVGRSAARRADQTPSSPRVGTRSWCRDCQRSSIWSCEAVSRDVWEPCREANGPQRGVIGSRAPAGAPVKDKSEADVTQLLQRVSSGGAEALDELIQVVHGELRRQAARYLRRERRNHTLQPTALVNEAFM